MLTARFSAHDPSRPSWTITSTDANGGIADLICPLGAFRYNPKRTEPLPSQGLRLPFTFESDGTHRLLTRSDCARNLWRAKDQLVSLNVEKARLILIGSGIDFV